MINWYQFSAFANILLFVSLLAVSLLIVIPVVRLRLLREKKLATASAILLFTIAVGRGMGAVHFLVPGADRQALPVTFWWEAVWNVLTAGAAIYFLSLYRFLGQLLIGSSSFDAMVERQDGQRQIEPATEGKGQLTAEAERDVAASMLRSIVANNQAAIYVKDLSGRYLLGNPRHAEIMGRAEADFLGLTDVIVDPQLASAWGENDLRARSGLFRVDEITDVFPDGRHYYESVRFPLYDQNGNVYATAGSSLDVTEERRSKAAVEEARDAAIGASAAKSTFLATMSHEIRTPMNAVIGMTDLLLDTSLDEHQYEFVDTVRVSGDALLSVINDILDFSKIESGELRIEREPFFLHQEVESCLDLVVAEANAKKLDLICYVDETCPEHVVGDAARLRQIVVNLLSNAVKFTSEGEILLTVSASTTEDGRLLTSLKVSDTGIGISDHGVERLFASFSQVDASTTRVYGGTGLGLVISQRLAEAMGGSIEVKSVPGVGSTFLAQVLVDPCLDTDVLPVAPMLLDLDGVSVLLVDDNITCLRTLRLQLTHLGMSCTAVATPGQALDLVRDGATFDVIVVDMLMPEMNGVQLSNALREVPAAADTPIILVTSVSSRPAGAEGLFAALLAKPVKGGSLRKAVSAALTGQPSDELNERRHPFDRAIVPLRVLLAEDNAVNQRVAQLMLSKLGHHVDTVETGAAAVAAVTAKPYDVILMDVQMPEMDGLEATQQIRLQIPAHQQPYIVAVTASALVEDREACAAAGMESYLTKPVRAHELRTILAAVPPSSHSAAPREQPSLSSGTGNRNGSSGSSLATKTPPVDQTVLEQLSQQLDDQTGQMLGELIESYLADSAEQIAQLVSAGERRDATAVLTIAHSLRSTSGLLGASGLVELLQQSETAARSTPDRLPTLVRLAQAEYDRAAAMLLEIRNTPSARELQDQTVMTRRS